MRVRFLVWNLKLGGQVTAVWAAIRALREVGVDADLLLPRAAHPGSKPALVRYGQRPLVQRFTDAWKLLRESDRLVGNGILHLVLPTPAHMGIVRAARVAPARVVVQYEGPCTQFDADHLRALADDPLLVAPRLVANHARWATVARSAACTHIATYPGLGRQLRDLGCERVELVPNLADLDGDLHEAGPAADEALLHDLADPQRNWRCVAYLGHAHPMKGIDDLVDAFARAVRREDRSPLRLLLGLHHGGDAARVLRRVRDLGVGPEIDLAGVLPIARVLKSVDALVLPWRAAVTTALYPSLVLEAAAAQCPIVATSLPELNELWVPGHPGVRLVRPRDVDGLARALEEVPRRREAQSRSSPLTLPDRQTVTQQLTAVYARALR